MLLIKVCKTGCSVSYTHLHLWKSSMAVADSRHKAGPSWTDAEDPDPHNRDYGKYKVLICEPHLKP